MLSSTLGDHKLLLGSLAGVTALACGVACYRRYLKNRQPSKWIAIAKVSDLYLYPIKSCKGIKSTELECTEIGCKSGELRDRMFVVVNSEGHFVTGREYPKLTQLNATLHDGKLKLSSSEDPDGIEVDFRNLEIDSKEVRIWSALSEGTDCGDEVAKWVSRFVLEEDVGLRLMYNWNAKAKEINPRIVEAVKVTKTEFRQKDSALYSDAAAYLLISDTSVQELNARLSEEKVSPRNFRPNIVISGEMLIPFEEDAWDWIKIGDAVFRCLTPCTRCLFTTVNPENGEKSKAMEPLRTLQKYRYVREAAKRKIFSSPAMGVYLGLRGGGTIAVGDDVMIPAI